MSTSPMDTDIEAARQLIVDAVRQVEDVLEDKPVDALYNEMGDSAMVFRVRWWIESYTDSRRVPRSRCIPAFRPYWMQMALICHIQRRAVLLHWSRNQSVSLPRRSGMRTVAVTSNGTVDDHYHL